MRVLCVLLLAVSMVVSSASALPPQAPVPPQAPSYVADVKPHLPGKNCKCGCVETGKCVCKDCDHPKGADPRPPNPNCQCGCTKTGQCDCKDCDHPALKPKGLAAPISWDEYSWAAFADGDLTQCKLMRHGRQVGVWTWADRRYWPIISGRISDVSAPVPIPPPYSPQWPSGQLTSAPVMTYQPNVYRHDPTFSAPVQSNGSAYCRGGG